MGYTMRIRIIPHSKNFKEPSLATCRSRWERGSWGLLTPVHRCRVQENDTSSTTRASPSSYGRSTTQSDRHECQGEQLVRFAPNLDHFRLSFPIVFPGLLIIH
ncbi:unnamed protein product [Echinostoma caproni]|uniref:Uncharacterized protein n=1 Tax=Echinostoma caproni TaxID=27848 RepID=A0A3P8HFM1_9TREM|nr:unnamed protein product [Echinostoma caproni]